MKLKVTAVSYLNTKPFLYGIFKSQLNEEIDLKLDIPSECARRLVSGDADLGLVPVAVIPEISNAHIISDYCIGSTSEVRTVCIVADRPLEELQTIYLDYHSRTSVELCRILLKNFWQLGIQLIHAQPGFEQMIGDRTGALVIGDRAITISEKHSYFYDLGEAWRAHSGLPFVYAAWVSNRPLEQDFIDRFNAALKLGIDHIPQLMFILPSPQPGFDLEKYFTENISYRLDSAKREGLSTFLSEMAGVGRKLAVHM